MQKIVRSILHSKPDSYTEFARGLPSREKILLRKFSLHSAQFYVSFDNQWFFFTLENLKCLYTLMLNQKTVLK